MSPLHSDPVPIMPGALERVILTEEKARALLGATSGNLRQFRKSHGVFLAREMLEGRWRWDSPQPFYVVDEFGTVMDGQHRLWAFLAFARVRPGVRVEVWTGHGFDASVATVLDQGRLRAAQDMLPPDMPYRVSVSSIARLVLGLHREQWGAGGRFKGSGIPRPLVVSYALAAPERFIAGAKVSSTMLHHFVTYSAAGAGVLPVLRPEAIPFMRRVADQDDPLPIIVNTRMALGRLTPTASRNDIPFRVFATLHAGFEAYRAEKAPSVRYLRTRCERDSLPRWWPQASKMYRHICDDIFGPVADDSAVVEVPDIG